MPPLFSTQTATRYEQMTQKFAETFGDARGVVVVRAPGRVNLIGEHTDYNGGFVLPIAIDRDIAVACRPNGMRQVNLCSMDFNDRVSFSLDRLARDEQHKWANYVQGVAKFLMEEGAQLGGFDGVIQGNVPIGAGVSSSAAMEVASAMAFTHLFGLKFEKMALALLCQKAENKFVGVNCGIMDQFVSLFGAAGHAVLIDCRSLKHELVPFDASRAVVVICNTGVKRELAASAYNERRAQCEEAVQRLSKRFPGISALRDVSVAQFQASADDLPQPIRRRTQHVLTENQRALDSVQALRQGNMPEFGRLMNESHESLRVDYEVTCPELDVMVALARSVRGTYGSRMTGAGFGGCTVSLVAPGAVDDFRQRVAAGYREAIGIVSDISVVVPADGAGRVV